MNVQHHCRNCGEIFCNNCTNQRITLPAMGYSSPVRVCYNCAKQILEHQHPIEKERNSLSYSDSELSDYNIDDNDDVNQNLVFANTNA
jgi:hypothetical protein